MIRLQIQETASGWYVHVHPDKDKTLEQNYAFNTKLEALRKAKDVVTEWIDYAEEELVNPPRPA